MSQFSDWMDVARDLGKVTTSHEDAIALGRQAVLIGQFGGISDEKLEVLLHLAATGMTRTVRRRLREFEIEPELADAVVIDRVELPPAVWQPVMGRVEAGGNWGDYSQPPEYHRQIALAHLAIAEWLAAHPRIDEGAVGEVAHVIAGDGQMTDEHITAARRLVEQGWMKKEQP